MSDECPWRGHTQVVHLEGWWKELPHESAAYKENTPPTVYEVGWLVPFGLVAGSIAAFAAGSILVGVLLLLGGVGAGGWMGHRARVTAAELAEWKRMRRCLTCAMNFAPAK